CFILVLSLSFLLLFPTRRSSDLLDRRMSPQSRFPRANPQWIFDGAELNGVKLFHIPRWKRILDLTWIFLTLPVWLPLMILLMLVDRKSTRLNSSHQII